MDPVANPYSPGAGTPPPALVGRDAELAAFDTAVRRLGIGRPAKSVMLTGLRGVGKTVLLREFSQLAKSHGWVHEQIEATEAIRFPEAVAMLTRKALLRLSVGQRAAARVRRALGVLKSFQLRWSLPDSGDLTLEVDPVAGLADSGVLDDDLTGLFIEVGELARERGLGVLITIDEIQYLTTEHLGALIMALHRVAQEQLPLMVAGAGLPSLPALAGEAKSYAERLFNFAVIGRLGEAEAGAALLRPAKDEGVHWDPSAIDAAVGVAEGYPYFLQEFGKQAWDVAEGPDTITAADVDNAMPIAIAELDTGFFRVRIDRTTDAERAYLRAMASLGSGPYGSGEIAAAMGKTTTQVGPYRDTLIKRGLCYSPRYGLVAFTVPMFDQFLRRWLA
ncbi:MAG: ATP-binding protein [Actinomycetota bacterium]|nr:ATP-binding protein [Actinomycetota bacterium]